MRLITFLLFITITVTTCAATSHRRLAAVDSYKKSWYYFTLDKPLKGKTLINNQGCCCFMNIAATTFVVTAANDTIRVISSCENELLNPGDSVLISPLSKDTVSRQGISDLKYDRIVTKTCYGTVTKLK